MNASEDILDIEFDNVVMPYTEMATVGRDVNNNFIVIVNPDTGRNNAYFKFCNHQRYDRSTKVIRLDFKSSKYYNHKGDGKYLWRINNSEVKMLLEFLNDRPKNILYRTFKTNWELAIFHWNNECGFTDDPEYDESFPEGCNPNSTLFRNPQFVPLNQRMSDYSTLRF